MSNNFRSMALYDIHVGWERFYRDGRMVTAPTWSQPALNTAFEFMDYWEPSTVLLGGDQLECFEISHWNAKKRALLEGLRLKEAFEKLDECVLTPIEDRLRGRPNTRLIWLNGNHEKWLNDFLVQEPAFQGLIGLDDNLKLKKRGWEFYDCGEIARIGKCHYVHGDALRSGKGHAAAALSEYGNRNIRYGHFHTSQVVFDRSSYDRPNDRHSAKGVPCLRSLNPAFLGNKGNAWVHGFLAGIHRPDGTFTDYVIEMVKHSFLWHDREFTGKSK